MNTQQHLAFDNANPHVDLSDVPSLATSGLLVTITTRKWNPNKLDKAASEEAARANGVTDPKLARVHKTLLKSDALTRIGSLNTRIHETNRQLTLEWLGNLRFAPTAVFPKWMAEVTRMQQEWDTLVDTFIIDDYLPARAAIISELGRLYDGGDYPEAEVLRRKFSFSYDTMPIPDSGDLRVDIAGEIKASVAEKYNRMYKDKIEGATRDMFWRVYEALAGTRDNPDKPDSKGLIELLEGTTKPDGSFTKGRLSASRIEGMRTLIDLMGDLNIANDPLLDETRRDLMLVFDGIRTTDDLKDQADREAIKAKLQTVMDKLPSTGW